MAEPAGRPPRPAGRDLDVPGSADRPTGHDRLTEGGARTVPVPWSAVDTTSTTWHLLLRRQWPLAVALGILLFLDLSYLGGRAEIVLWMLEAGIAVASVITQRWPVEGALLVAVGILGGTSLRTVIEFSGVMNGVVSGMTPVETAAGMAAIAIAIRLAKSGPATIGVLSIVAAGMVAGTLRPRADLFDSPTTVALPGLLLMLSVATGLYFKARDTDRRRSLTAAVNSAQQDERLSLARELHDVVAHHVTGIVVQAQAAQVVAEQDPMAAQRVLPSIEKAGTEALSAMRSLIGSLRDTASHAVPAEIATTDPIADLQSVVDDARATGLPVRLSLDVPPGLPIEMGRSVLRVVQESLTNARKYAEGVTSVRVAVSRSAGLLHVLVTDDGTQTSVPPAAGSSGYGLIGLRERVELLRGGFSAGPRLTGGWEVHAWLPMEETNR